MGGMAAGGLLLIEVGGGWIAVLLGLIPALAVAADLRVRPAPGRRNS